MAIKYDDVNQVAFSKASRSAATEDCVVVRIDMLVAVLLLELRWKNRVKYLVDGYEHALVMYSGYKYQCAFAKRIRNSRLKLP